MGTEVMHEHSTRAWTGRRRESVRTAALLVAAILLPVFGAVIGSSPARSGTGGGTEVAVARPDIPIPLSDVAHQIAITTVTSGQEGLQLSAKLAENGGGIERPIHWTITGMDGGIVFKAEVPVADVPVPPGDYVIDIDYGAAHFQRALTVVEGNRLAVSFVLNVPVAE